MKKSLFYIFFSTFIQNTIVKGGKIVTLYFFEDKNLSISSLDLTYKMFNYFNLKDITSIKDRNFDLRQFQSQTFMLLKNICKKEDLNILSLDSFVDILKLIDFLELNDNYLETDIFWNNLISSVFKFTKNDNSKFTVNNVANLKTCKPLVLNLLEKCLKCLKSNTSIDFKNEVIRIYLDNNIENSKIINCYIINQDNYYFSKNSLKLMKTIFFFCKSINFLKVLIFQDSYTLLLIMFDTINVDCKEKDINPFYESIKIIEDEFKPTVLSFTNVINKDQDLNILSNLISVEELEIRNDIFTELKISNFILPKLSRILLINVNLSIRGLCYLTASKNLSLLNIFGSHLLNKDDCVIKYFLNINIKDITIRNCLIDSLFFDWYDQIKNIKSLTFDNNISTRSNISEEKDFLLKRLINYSECCFSEMQIKTLIKNGL